MNEKEKQGEFFGAIFLIILAIFQFGGHLSVALSDGKLTYDEISFLLKTANGAQLFILIGAVAAYLVKKMKGKK